MTTLSTETPQPEQAAPAPRRLHDDLGLTAEQVAELGRELDAIRDRCLAQRGASDAAYIRRVIAVQRSLEAGSRALLLFSRHRPARLAGTAGLTLAKILENMEIGHNVMHGQWDWMRDPRIHSTTWEWDNASPAAQWKHSHNQVHHTYTNVIGRDNDLGYGIMRVCEEQRWKPFHLGQPLWNLLNAMVFEYSIAAYDLEIGRYLAGRADKEDFHRRRSEVLRKIRDQATKDYVVHPLLSGRSAPYTLAANLTANLLRNLWTHSVIVCGHFPEGVQTFPRKAIRGESRGEWYLRQMMGAANISGGPLTHLLTGNLSHQIEHHLFPDLPSNRYAEVAPEVRAVFAKYGLRYVTGPFPRQLASSWGQVVRYSVPNGTWERLAADPAATLRSGLKALRGGGRKRGRGRAGAKAGRPSGS
ncbi:fatty acid desaturase family protein [Streptomyces polyrhachis]|uniref:Fatty acid desaturase family protein n=1 Tax=Streptomyces polyrhachis TaxID=1282885 RepID=A0ABW2GI89_9ACTN